MKLKHLIVAVVMMLPFAASAVPAYPGIITRTNPDGTTVELRVCGDEYFSYVINTEDVLMQKHSTSSRVRLQDRYPGCGCRPDWREE